MTGKKSQKQSNVLSRQWRTLIILGVLSLCGMGGLAYLISDNKTSESKTETPNFGNPFEHVDAESFILEKTQKKLEETQKKTDSIEQKLDELVKKNENISSNDNGNDIKKRLETLEKELNEKTQYQRGHYPSDQGRGADKLKQDSSFSLSRELPNNIEVEEEEKIREDKLALAEDADTHHCPIKNPETYVPAGTFVKAVMIGGADASASVSAQANPVPMVFRIVESGTLPNKRKSHLKDCVVTAAVVGDISSERGLIRLENLSCTFPNNEIVDQPVEGTVFGPEGKNGVRGNPIWREGALLQRAFFAGALSGLSEGVSQTYTANSITPQGNVQTIDPSHIFQFGAAKGAGKAMDKLADYNIQRAEQYHPVIQLSAGTVVDVVFLKGFFLDGKKHGENNNNDILKETNSTSPSLFQVPENISGPKLPLSPEAIKRIDEKSKELGLRVTHADENELKRTGR